MTEKNISISAFYLYQQIILFTRKKWSQSNIQQYVNYIPIQIFHHLFSPITRHQKISKQSPIQSQHNPIISIPPITPPTIHLQNSQNHQLQEPSPPKKILIFLGILSNYFLTLNAGQIFVDFSFILDNEMQNPKEYDFFFIVKGFNTSMIFF
ncbi:hypothetical protein TTHERM_00283590 (macronuclear) [Tetrahymena thermophila SB210]|uniref:Uncharacterized protein n=1 Tax=Tetrahymena thermophila (strain SB210) TaxID=312017 RepID=I7M1X5_TETTS|nr:hypothetical protein TTHERM_00283590 [Tetrahymena thermophila SB210]EAR97970.1 hypothetical protein TTHERM_00283590 [Tetrahymena thermophila SB210]|eukprot:XP_001018215.1 hypothetical protein TTHERM_00283590 [Tetrahymena thermophila SB210]